MENSPYTPHKTAKEKLLEAAAKLFYEYGISATGIDLIVKKANVAKKSLYNNFSSKADLVAQYIEIRHKEWLDLYNKRLQHTPNSIDKIIAVFDAYIDHAEKGYEHGFRGCGLLNAAAELPAHDIGRTVVKKHKEAIEYLLYIQLRQIFPHNKEQAKIYSRHLSFLLEGGITRSGLEGNSDCINQAKQMAIILLKNAQ